MSVVKQCNVEKISKHLKRICMKEYLEHFEFVITEFYMLEKRLTDKGSISKVLAQLCESY